ncbi:MAG: hypothetical protein P4L16_06495 [Chlamydiales bacterium]|nr:hypothetical protein [Chlamydiales bacterium]
MSSSPGDIDYKSLINSYQTMSSDVNAQTIAIGKMSASSVQMSALFQLQMKMNTLAMFGQTLTNVIQGVQDIAMAVARNTKGG